MRVSLLAGLVALGTAAACTDTGTGGGIAAAEGEVFFASDGTQDRRIRMTPFGDGVNFNVFVQAPDRDSAIRAYHEACWNTSTLDLAGWDGDMVPFNAATGEHRFVGHCPDKRA